MSFDLKCQHCSTVLEAEDEWIGMETDCPKCGKNLVISKTEIHQNTKPSPPITSPKQTKNMDGLQQQITLMIAEGKPYFQIAAELNQKNVKAPNSEQWNNLEVEKVITQYIGDENFQTTKKERAFGIIVGFRNAGVSSAEIVKKLNKENLQINDGEQWTEEMVKQISIQNPAHKIKHLFSAFDGDKRIQYIVKKYMITHLLHSNILKGEYIFSDNCKLGSTNPVALKISLKILKNEYYILYKVFCINYLFDQIVSQSIRHPNAVCFIATATFQSENHDAVIRLRHFRDSFLTNYIIGQKFISIYYKYGPGMAKIVRYYPSSRLLLVPILTLLSFVLDNISKRNAKINSD